MIPVCDAVPAPSRPIVTLALMAGTALAFAVLPAAGTAGVGWTSFGGPWGPLVINAALGMLWPADWLALGATIAALWLFGPTVEDRLGHGRFAVLYAGGGFLAAMAVGAAGLADSAGMGGAAGCVAAVIGARLALYPKGRTLILVPDAAGIDIADVHSALLAGFWFLAQMASVGSHLRTPPSWSPAAAVVHMLAGAVAGSAGVRVLVRQDRMRVEWWNP